MVKRILADFDGAYGLRSLSLHYFNAAGADKRRVSTLLQAKPIGSA